MAPSPAHDTAFRRIYDECFPAVQRYCLRRLPVADANDAVSEVFLVAWTKRSSIPTAALPWLYGVAHNVVRNQRRTARRTLRLRGRASAEPVYPDLDAETQVIRGFEDDRIVATLEAMPEQDRDVLMLRAWEGLTAREIAGVVGCSVPAAEKRLVRATRRFESALGAHPHATREERP
ncbi:MAG: sigma-70 family RNA polymerase sigma factor [Acidimicrobiia bacterium]|nr:sigma-70 family RNA polymerase sigma factor [Acidimicrobiia bacterium]